MAVGNKLHYPKHELQDYDHLTDLLPKQRDTLNEWVDYFDRKYPQVGTLMPFRFGENVSDEEFTGGGWLDS